MAKFELTYNQYINVIRFELINRLSDECTVKIIKNPYIERARLETLIKEYHNMIRWL